MRTSRTCRGVVPRAAALAGVIIGLAAAAPVVAQDTTEESDEAGAELWLNFRAVRPLQNKQWATEFDVRTDGTVSSLGGRSGINFYPLRWLDVFPEIDVKYTDRPERPNTFNTTLRAGFRFRLPHVQRVLDRERVPLHRFDFGALLRLEWSNVFTDDSSSDSWRARGRIEAKFPLNRGNISVDKAVYLQGDAEAFVPVGDESDGVFVNRGRIRAGAGDRLSFPWRIEALGIWEAARARFEDDFGANEFILMVRLHHFFQ